MTSLVAFVVAMLLARKILATRKRHGLRDDATASAKAVDDTVAGQVALARIGEVVAPKQLSDPYRTPGEVSAEPETEAQQYFAILDQAIERFGGDHAQYVPQKTVPEKKPVYVDCSRKRRKCQACPRRDCPCRPYQNGGR